MDPNLVWFILFNPLIAAALIHLVTRKSPGVSTFISVASSVFGLIAAIGIFATKGGQGLNQVEIPWLDFGPELRIPIGLMIDDLSKLMLLVVTGIGAAVHIYSTVYME